MTVIYTPPRLVVRVVPPPARAACGKFQPEPSKCGRVSSGMAREIEEAQRLGIPIRQIGELEIKQEALPAEMEQSEAPGQSMGMA